MKKLIMVIVLTAIVTVGVTVMASETGLIDGIKTKMKNDVNTHSNTKVTEIDTAIQAAVEEALEETRVYQTNRVKKAVDDYLTEKLTNLDTNGAVNDASIQLMHYATQLITEEKAKIDQAIADALSN
jgi:hypothetical protein